MLATVLSRAQFAMEAPLVCVEVYLGAGLPQLSIVGLPQAEVRESRDRVRSAILTSNYRFPEGRIIVNLAPADLPKEGGRFDLPIALGLLVASGQLPPDRLGRCEFYGELSLSGELRPMRGTLPAVCRAMQAGHRVIVPLPNLAEGALVQRALIAPAAHLLDVCRHLQTGNALEFRANEAVPPTSAAYPDLADVRGQLQARRALEIAAAGSHSLLLWGPPGTGKSMLAHRLPGIVPPMSEAEALETATVASVSSRGFPPESWGRRPFRAPHHTASAVALVGGGSPPRPGEISLAHNGVLFLDELPEFNRHVLEAMREPLEAGTITISRAGRQSEFPARFQLVAAMNPCPCGHLGDPAGKCRCTGEQVQRYRARISGPLLDRIDLRVEAASVDVDVLDARAGREECSDDVKARVLRAREIQLQRQAVCNAHLGIVGLEEHCSPTSEGRRLLEVAAQRLGFSARAYHRMLRVARTIADLEGSGPIEPRHVAEAIQLRRDGTPG